jgi:hypothetical protein
MSPTAARFAALSCGLVPFGLRVLYRFWGQTLFWSIEPGGRRLALDLAAELLLGMIPFGVLIWIIGRLVRGPASLGVDAARARFLAPAHPIPPALLGVLLMWAASGMILAERVPDGDSMRLAQLDAGPTRRSTVRRGPGVPLLAVLC